MNIKEEVPWERKIVQRNIDFTAKSCARSLAETAQEGHDDASIDLIRKRIQSWLLENPYSTWDWLRDPFNDVSSEDQALLSPLSN